MQKFLLSRVEVWVVAVVVLIGILLTLLFGSLVLDAVRKGRNAGQLDSVIVGLADVPNTVEKLVAGDQADMIAVRNSAVKDGSGWTFPDGSTGVPGYELLSRFDGDTMSPVVELVSLKDGSVRHAWKLNVDRLLEGARRDSQVVNVTNWTQTRFRPYHPDIMSDGGLIVKDTEAPLFRIDACGNRIWINDAHLFHHAMEPDGEGGYWTGTFIEPPTIPKVPPTFRDDAAARIDIDGHVLTEISIADMLMRHGLLSLVLPPGEYTDDPLHLNDVQPVLDDGPFWKKGDLFISLRHKSIVMLYRPSTDEIVWKREGPWSCQHDVDILDDHRIAIFDNNAYNPGDFGRVAGWSEVLIYNFETDAVTSPWRAAMEREDIKALYEGLYTILPGGELLLEDHNSGRVFVFSPDGRTLARFVNRASDGNVYALGWGRYIPQDRGDQLLKTLTASCPTMASN